MDEARADRLGAKPIAPLLAEIDAVKDGKGMIEEVARLQRQGVDAVFAVGAGQDAKDSTRVILQFVQGGLGLPTRDYYLATMKSRKRSVPFTATISPSFSFCWAIRRNSPK
jgi:putative endopeptidase